MIEPFTIIWYLALAISAIISVFLCYLSGLGACMGLGHALMPIWAIVMCITVFCCGFTGVTVVTIISFISLFVGLIRSAIAHGNFRGDL